MLRVAHLAPFPYLRLIPASMNIEVLRQTG